MDEKMSKYSHLRQQSLGEILKEIAHVTDKQMADAVAEQQVDNSRKLGEILLGKKTIKESQLAEALAIQLDLPFYTQLPVDEIDPHLVHGIPIQFCRDNLVLPIAKDAFSVTLAVYDPLNTAAIDDLRLLLSTNINLVVCPPNIVRNCINKIYEKAHDASKKVIAELSDTEGSTEDLEEAKDLLEASDDEKPIIRLVNSLLSRAVKEKASDIHIEPYDLEVLVRFRIDGALYEAMQIPKRHLNSIVSRIKIIGKLNIAEKRIPQDGRIGVKVAGKDIDIRLSVIPTKHGERIVMRILDKSSGVMSLEEMGMDPQTFGAWKALIGSKHGIILVTGPTGSGKTSLLYSSVVEINKPDVNIMTIEDPVEYTLPGVGQIDVKTKIGMTFAAGLRSILRQDPDVIMIGEIRDAETANIAVQSSLTGHLVFSTVHTNDAPSTITRLDDLDIQPFQIASSILGIMATRLIRKLCAHCRVKHEVTTEELKVMELTPADVEGKTIYAKGTGCEKCFTSGYSGRISIHELLVVDDAMREMIMKTQDSNSIRKQAEKSGMRSLRQSAVAKVLAGYTSIEEAISKTQTEELEI